jgi:hypothetical protein
MTDNTAFQRFEETIPPGHDCPGDECIYPPGLYALVVKDPDAPDDPTAFQSTLYIHRVTPGHLAAALVVFMDSAFLDNRAEDVPAMIAHSRGRDLLRAAVEQTPPPPVVAQELFEFVEATTEDWKGLLS